MAVLTVQVLALLVVCGHKVVASYHNTVHHITYSTAMIKIEHSQDWKHKRPIWYVQCVSGRKKAVAATECRSCPELALPIFENCKCIKNMRLVTQVALNAHVAHILTTESGKTLMPYHVPRIVKHEFEYLSLKQKTGNIAKMSHGWPSLAYNMTHNRIRICKFIYKNTAQISMGRAKTIT